MSNADALARTTRGQSIAGTLDYAAPEQLGKLGRVAVGPYSDVYGFGKTLCYAVFGTAQPGPRHWRTLGDEEFAELLGQCIEEGPEQRPQGLAEILRRLQTNPAPLARENKEADQRLPVQEAEQDHLAAQADFSDVRRDFEEYRTALIQTGGSKAYLLRTAPGRLQRWRDAAEKGLGEAQAMLGDCYEEGAAAAADPREALRWYRPAAEAGVGTAMANMGGLYCIGKGVSQDYAEGVRWLIKAADTGCLSPGLLYLLGAAYEKGRGVGQNEQEALHWYHKAAEAGDVEAMVEVGERYKEGNGVRRDDTKALLWFRKAADAGKAAAMSEVGTMYREGRGTPRNLTEALRWFHKAADAGNPSAMTALAQLYMAGDGVECDLAEARRWVSRAKEAAQAQVTESVQRLRKLAEEGNAEVMYQLGTYYRDGKLVEKNRDEAIRWLEQAANRGHQEAATALQSLRAGRSDRDAAEEGQRRTEPESRVPLRQGVRVRWAQGGLIIAAAVVLGVLVGGAIGFAAAPYGTKIVGVGAGALLGLVVGPFAGVIIITANSKDEEERNKELRKVLPGFSILGCLGLGIAGWFYGPDYIHWSPSPGLCVAIGAALGALLAGVFSVLVLYRAAGR
jgi:TPR repeat protein